MYKRQVLDGRIGSDFLEKVSKSELIGLSWYDAGARNFYNSKKPITCLEDMAGMRIRVQESEVMVDMVEALGATALPIPLSLIHILDTLRGKQWRVIGEKSS